MKIMKSLYKIKLNFELLLREAINNSFSFYNFKKIGE